MALGRKDKEALAFDLYMHTDKTQKEIVVIVGVTEKTFSQWKQKGKWEELRSAQTLTAGNIIRQLYMRLDEATKQTDKDGKAVLDADKIIKLANAIEKLSNKQATISQTINVFKEFISFTMERDPELGKKINELQKLFINNKING
jgi:hypothetical protein